MFENRRPTSFDEYWQHAFPLVEGWLDHRHGEMLARLDQIQRDAGIRGQVGEIGVYHGKLLLGLAHLADPGAKVTAIDIFDDQAKNLDGAGDGNLHMVEENIRRYGPDVRDWRCITADSIALTAFDKHAIMAERGPFRLFSVDGCHTAEHTFNDILTAQDMLADGGVLIVDDFMQPHWPGVTEAVHLFYGRTVPRLRPFLYCYHKLYLVGCGWHARFQQSFAAMLGDRPNVRTVPMFGSPVVSVYL